MLKIKQYEDNIKKLCAQLSVKRMSICGSAATDQFGPKSDIDVIVEFDRKANKNLFDEYFTLKEELEKIFNKPVDIIIERSVRNPFLKESLDSTRKDIYVASNK